MVMMWGCMSQLNSNRWSRLNPQTAQEPTKPQIHGVEYMALTTESLNIKAASPNLKPNLDIKILDLSKVTANKPIFPYNRYALMSPDIVGKALHTAMPLELRIMEMFPNLERIILPPYSHAQLPKDFFESIGVKCEYENIVSRCMSQVM